MVKVKIETASITGTLHCDKITGEWNKDEVQNYYYLKTDLNISGLNYPNVEIPLTEKEYKTLEKQFNNSDPHFIPIFTVEGNLEISVKSSKGVRPGH